MSQPLATQSTLFEAIALINSGQIAQAEAVCRAAVERNGQDVNMTALLGATLFKSGKNQEAEKYLRISTDLAPNFAKPWSDLGHLLVETRRPEEAVAVLENALRLDPGEADAWFNLGKARAMLGLGPQADEAFEKSFELNPERKALAYAAEHQQAGRLEEAEKAYRDILGNNPKNVDALRLLGTLAMKAGREHEAESLFRRAIAYAPDYVEAHIALGRCMKEQHRLQAAIQSFETAIALEPDSVQANFMLASVLAPAARTYDAIAAYRKVISIKPQHPGAWLGLGHSLKTVGLQAEAIEAYRECIRLKPGNGETYWSMANLKTYQLTDEDISAMQAQVARKDLDEELDVQSRVNFLFALAKAYEDRHDYEQAWTLYEEGNSSQRMEENYDPVQTEVMNDALISVFDAGFLQQHSGQGNPSPEPIFIVGLPRSGSTLLEQILASHSMVEGTAELPYINSVSTSLNRNRADGVNYPHAVKELRAEHFHRLGQDYLDLARIHRTGGKPRFIDKMPNNFPSIGLLHLILPNCKIIDARRYPMDSCLSCYRQLFARGQSFTYDQTDIGEYFLQYQRMMDYWHEVLPGRCLTVQYEDLVLDFDNQVRRLLEYCELPWEENCVRFYETERPVRTASSEQVRQPVYTRSINFWRNYENHLDELQSVLAPALPRYAQYAEINR